MELDSYIGAVPPALRRQWRVWAASFLLACVIVVGYRAAFSPPDNFPVGSIVSIARGASAPSVAAQLADAHIIAHAGLLRAVLRLSGKSDHIQAGAYLFTTPQNLFVVAYRLVTGAYGLPPVRLTFPEGETARDAAARVAEEFSTISTSDFLAAARPYEGYLFPDTYLFSPSSDASIIIQAMRSNFNTKITPLLSDVAASGHSLSDIVVMASLLEKEARSDSVRRVIAGILWNRFARGMPLQVDAVFGYIFDRDTYSPSLADLKVDSPYNTYTHTGLPPGPINNPGLAALDSALHPTKTDYLYYLTDKNGVMHYATTYAQHLANQRKYLR